MNVANEVDVELDKAFTRRIGALLDSYFVAQKAEDITRIVAELRRAEELYKVAEKAIGEL